MISKSEPTDKHASFQRSPRLTWIAAASVALTVAALISGLGTSTVKEQRIASGSTAPELLNVSETQNASYIGGVAKLENVSEPDNATTEQRTAVQNSASEAEQLRTSRLLHDADRISPAFKIIGPNTKSVVELCRFFDSVGWNDVIDGMTMKSCPDGYEFFCQARGVLLELYEKSGGDVRLVAELARNMDFREHIYQLASAADLYPTQYQSVSD